MKRKQYRQWFPQFRTFPWKKSANPRRTREASLTKRSWPSLRILFPGTEPALCSGLGFVPQALEIIIRVPDVPVQVVCHFATSRLERSRPAADASREVVERWLLNGLM